MGTNTVAYVDYHVPDDLDRTLELLGAATLRVFGNETYWQSVDGRPANRIWEIESTRGTGLVGSSFDGPGGISLWFYPQVARIHSCARWRAFLIDPALRDAHLAAFKAVARAINATAILFVPDYADDEWIEGASFDEVKQLLEQTWHAVPGDLNRISPEVFAECKRCPPKAWFLERL